MATQYTMIGNVVIGEMITFDGNTYKVEQVEHKPRGKEHQRAVGLSHGGRLFKTRQAGDYIKLEEVAP
jgi:hypothetical protein